MNDRIEVHVEDGIYMGAVFTIGLLIATNQLSADYLEDDDAIQELMNSIPAPANGKQQLVKDIQYHISECMPK